MGARKLSLAIEKFRKTPMATSRPVDGLTKTHTWNTYVRRQSNALCVRFIGRFDRKSAVLSERREEGRS